jgi:hypothetical protein
MFNDGEKLFCFYGLLVDIYQALVWFIGLYTGMPKEYGFSFEKRNLAL